MVATLRLGMDANTISIREFARRLGISDTSVHKAIKAGKISAGLDKTDIKRPKIIYEIALKEWGENYAPKNPANDKVGNALKTTTDKTETPLKVISINRKQVEVSEDDNKTNLDIPADDNIPIKIRNSAEYGEAKRVEAVVKARTAQLEYGQLKGTLVSSKDVYKELYAVGQSVRAAMQGIPDKYIDNILACDTRSEAHEMLTKAITDALEELSNATKDVEL